MRWHWRLLNLGLLLAGIGFTGTSVYRWLVSGARANVPWGHPWIALGVITLATLAVLATTVAVARRWLRRG